MLVGVIDMLVFVAEDWKGRHSWTLFKCMKYKKTYLGWSYWLTAWIPVCPFSWIRLLAWESMPKDSRARVFSSIWKGETLNQCPEFTSFGQVYIRWVWNIVSKHRRSAFKTWNIERKVERRIQLQGQVQKCINMGL